MQLFMPPITRCAYCDQPLPASAVACPACGAPLDAPPAAQLPPPAGAPRSMPQPLPAVPPARKRPILLIAIFTCLGVFLCTLLVLGLIFAGRVADRLTPDPTPAALFVFEPAVSQASMVDPEQLAQAAQILNERARALGYAKADFSVNDQNQITGSLPADDNFQSIIKALTTAGIMELVDLGQTPLQPGDSIHTDFGITDQPQASGKIYHTLLTGAAFQDADVILDNAGNYQVSFTLNPEGKQALADYTTANIGSYLAIVLDKVIFSAPKVATPITDGKGVISGSFTQQQAQEIVALLKSGALPFPLQTIQAVISTP